MGIALGAAATTSMGQQITTIGKNADPKISIRIGDLIPINTEGRNIGKSWFVGGIDYRVETFPVGVGKSYSSVTADYYQKNSNWAVPIVFAMNSQQGRETFIAGYGIEDSQFSGGKAGIRLCGQVGIAYDLTTSTLPVFAEAKYFYSTHREFSGIGFFLGARF